MQHVSFTIHSTFGARREVGKVHHRTNNKSREKCIDPAHNQRLRNHHHHIPFHHPHHALHGGRVRHGVGGRLATVFLILEESSALVCIDKVFLACFEAFAGKDGACIVAHVDAVDQRETLARFKEGACGLGRGVHEHGCIVAEDSSKDLVEMVKIRSYI